MMSYRWWRILQIYYIATQGDNTGGPVVDQGLAITPRDYRYSGGGPTRSDNLAREELATQLVPSTVSGNETLLQTAIPNAKKYWQ